MVLVVGAVRGWDDVLMLVLEVSMLVVVQEVEKLTMVEGAVVPVQQILVLVLAALAGRGRSSSDSDFEA